MKIKKKDLYWITSGFFTIVQNLSGTLLSFGSFYLLVRVLSKHDYGAWGLFMATVTVLEFVRNGLTQSALIRYLSSSEKSDHPQIITASFFISGSLSVFFTILILIFAKSLATIWASPILEQVFYVYTISFFVAFVQSQFNCILQANLHFKGVFVNTIVYQSMFFGYVAFCYLTQVKIEMSHLVIVVTLGTVISTIIGYILAKPYISFSSTVNISWVKKLFNYGKYAFGTTLSSIIGSSIDKMMLGAMLSPAASGAFDIAVRITNLVDIPINAAATIIFPKSAQAMEQEGSAAVKYLYEKSVGAILAIIFPALLFLFIFSSFVVDLLAGSKYAEASILLHITLIYCILSPYTRQFGNILDSIGKTKTNFIVVMFSTIINISINYVLISRIGIAGAAYATLCSTFIAFVIGQIILKRELNVNFYNTFKYALRFYPEFIGKYIRPKS